MGEAEGVKQHRIGIILCGAVFCIALVAYLWHLNSLPLADYDEATYAQVTTDTLASGHFMTLSKFGQPWFEKPPLYFWLTIGAIKLFGTEDYVYRLVSIFAAIASCLLIWFIVKRLTDDVYIATTSSLILLSWPFFYLAARQARLDVPMISMLLVSLAALVAGWKKKRWYLLIGPALALGFLFKSFAIVSAILVLLIFSFWYTNFSWLRSKFFWIGTLIGTAVVIPWHWYMYSKWGSQFLSAYVGYHVLDRYAGGIGQNAGFQFFRYLQNSIIHGQPWVTVFIVAILFAVLRRFFDSSQKRDPLFRASAFSTVVIFGIFAFGRTAILTYLLPVFPFIAIVVGQSFVAAFDWARTRVLKTAIAAVLLVVFGFGIARASGIDPFTLQSLYYPWSQAQKEIGQLVRQGSTPETTFYLFEWPTNEALRYYSGKQLTFLGFPPAPDTILKGPWYLMLTNIQVPLFLDASGNVKPQYRDIQIKYTNDAGQLFLFAGEKDLVLSNK